ncbi:MAG: aldo/keto reductase [Candidatus Poribacteria bacterium]
MTGSRTCWEWREAPKIGGVGKESSRIAFGTAGCGVDRQDEWHVLLDMFVEAGGTLIDTGRGYGTSEDTVGGWLAKSGRREDVVIVTKCGLSPDEVLPDENFPSMMREELATSLRTLGTDYIDLYMLHRDNQRKPVGEIMDPLNEVLSDGVIDAIAASNWEYRRIDEANEYADKHGLRTFAAVSNNISLPVPAAAFYRGLVTTDRNAGEDWRRSTGAPLIPWSSQARGFFVDRHTREMRDAPPADPDAFSRRMLRVYGSDENYCRLLRAQQIGREKGGYTAMEVSLAWLLNRDLPIIPIVGPKTTGEGASCVRTLSLQLSESEIAHLDLRA